MTLVEMLVTVAVLVIIMTIMVQIFQSATGALSAAQTIQQLDDQLKLLDSTIRFDLGGATARFTPPLDPAQGLGYFEYGENEFADVQGEDGDDYLRFTAKAPPGQPFTGRMWVNPQNAVFFNSSPQPVTITSEYAEIIYFLRNGNLYRRVILILPPEFQPAIVPAIGNVPFPTNGVPLPNNNTFSPSSLGGALNVSWQGVNDISARPNTTGPNLNIVAPGSQAQAQQTIILNSLGDLTNRENRFAAPRFANDFLTIVPGLPPTFVPGPDGFFDDVNGDKVPDFYPSLYPGAFAPLDANGNPIQLLFPPPLTPANPTAGLQPLLTNLPTGLLAFPYIFPGAYSNPQHLAKDQFGWIHSPTPSVFVNNQGVQFDANPLVYLQNINHNPLDLGDNLPSPPNQAGFFQTWWGFPTWRETLSPSWNDPTVQVNVAFAQPNGLSPRSAAQVPVNDDANLLPPLAQPPTFNGLFSIFRQSSQLFCDTFGETSLFWGGANVGQLPLWSVTWEDDLIMTGVRSFDVKAYDNAFAGYVDLGWGDDLRLYLPYSTTANYLYSANNPPVPVAPPYLAGTALPLVWPPVNIVNPQTNTQYGVYNPLATFAHEGRMPPLVEDNRLDAYTPNPTYVAPNNFTPQYLGYNYSSNVGDDNPGVTRLRRVWDSWSTEYTIAPWQGVNFATNFMAGPVAGSPPIYPSYPPPYPAPLRGIQIQIRVADPTNQRIKSLTIRQDFTDKL